MSRKLYYFNVSIAALQLLVGHSCGRYGTDFQCDRESLAHLHQDTPLSRATRHSASEQKEPCQSGGRHVGVISTDAASKLPVTSLPGIALLPAPRYPRAVHRSLRPPVLNAHSPWTTRSPVSTTTQLILAHFLLNLTWQEFKLSLTS